jgi:hypothetical protein
MPCGKDKSVAIPPMRVLWIVVKKASPQHVGHGRRAHGQPRMPGARLLDHVDGEKADRVDAGLIEPGWGHDDLLVGAGCGLCQPPECATSRSASAGPHVPASYS